MNNKAQGALEYLLLIAGAILVAAVVIALLSGMAGTGKAQAQNAKNTAVNALENLKHQV